MLASRHDRTVEILYGLCKAHRSYRAVYADHLETPFKPIEISPSHVMGLQGKPYRFRPDLWARLKNNKIDLIEVWDEQSEAGGVQDFVLAALTPRIATFTIVCFDKATVDNAKALAGVILPSLHDEEGNRLLDPSEVTSRIIGVPEQIQNDDAALKKFLSDRLKSLWKSRPA